MPDLTAMARHVCETDGVREGWAAWADGRRPDVPLGETQKALEVFHMALFLLMPDDDGPVS